MGKFISLFLSPFICILLANTAIASYPIIIKGNEDTPEWTIEGDAATEEYVWTSMAGDLNGDGYADLDVAKGVAKGEPLYPGMIEYVHTEDLIYLGSPSGPGEDESWLLQSDLCFVAPAGDVNGDGFDDCTMYYGDSTENYGLYYGSASGLSGPVDWAPNIPTNREFFNTTGDVNGDGYADLITAFDAGSEVTLTAYYGSQSGPGSSPDWTTETNISKITGELTSLLKTDRVTTGDINNDGYSDLIVGISDCPVPDYPDYCQNYTLVYYGSPSGLETTVGWYLITDFSFSIYLDSGDVNGDGLTDLVVGGNEWLNPNHPYCRISICYGTPSGLSTSPEMVVEYDNKKGIHLELIDIPGDLNADGYSDVAIDWGYLVDWNPEAHYYKYYTTIHCGSSEGLNSAPYWTAFTVILSYSNENSHGGTGDVNNDGNMDILLNNRLYYGPLPEGTTELDYYAGEDDSDGDAGEDDSDGDEDNNNGGGGGGCFISNLF